MLISCLLSRADVRQVPLILFVFFFQKIILFYLHTCPAPQKSSVLLQSFVCFFKRNLKRRNWNEQIYVRLWQLFLKFEAFWTFFFWIISPADYFCFPFGQNPERELWCVSSFEKKKSKAKKCANWKLRMRHCGCPSFLSATFPPPSSVSLAVLPKTMAVVY